MLSATLSSKFQLSIPKVVREELHLRAGQKFAVITKGDVISLVPIPEGRADVVVGDYGEVPHDFR
ncbi:AbrB/MazE/SpoVT family DNA-binding domain-containing protein [Endothiovibrio diazotrophicus]